MVLAIVQFLLPCQCWSLSVTGGSCFYPGVLGIDLRASNFRFAAGVFTVASRGVNKVILVGNVGQDPETRHMPSGGAVANITLATSESWKDKSSGETRENTEWHRVVFFNRLAEIVGEYVRKGSKLYVEGRLQTRSWDDKDGVKRYTTEIVASEMQMLDSRGAGASSDQGDYGQSRGGSRGQQAAPAAAASSAGAAPANFDNFDDDIPF